MREYGKGANGTYPDFLMSVVLGYMLGLRAQGLGLHQNSHFLLGFRCFSPPFALIFSPAGGLDP